jgi:hypothetical protein
MSLGYFQEFTVQGPGQTEWELLRQHFAEPEPGWFQATVKPEAFPEPLRERVAMAGVCFTLHDPDCDGLPYHRRGEFLAVPQHWRIQFLLRNMSFVRLWAGFLSDVHRLSIALQQQQAPIPAPPCVDRLLRADSLLRQEYGLWHLFCDENGRIINPPRFEFIAEQPGLASMTERERRAFRSSWAERRRITGVTPRRNKRDDAYYEAALGAFDKREGCFYPPLRYEPTEAMPLQRALAEAKATKEQYYAAFRFVTGDRYSPETWVVRQGDYWQKHTHYRQYKGRQSGARPGRKPMLSTAPQAQPTPPLNSVPETMEAIERFMILVQSGMSFDEANFKTAALPDEYVLLLERDPSLYPKFVTTFSNRDAIL